MSRTGVLVAGYGGPDSLEAVAPFMCNLMDREPSDELVERVCRRYLAIGGSSPLPEIAGSFAAKLAEAIKVPGAERDIPVEVGMRYWHPFIEDGLARLKESGCDRVVVVSLSAFEAKISTQSSRDEITRVAAELELEIIEAPLISELPEFVEYLASSTAAALTDIEPNMGAIIAFTAHSLPLTELVDDDPYVAGLERIAQMVAGRLGLELGQHGAGENMFESFRAFGFSKPPRAWYLVYQSKGERPGGWLEPDLDGLIEACSDANVPALVVCPIGFVTDHLETLYDLDIVAADKALSADVEFARAPVPNDSDMLIEPLALFVLSQQ
ncbi:MAG TPA: ferrochelatase [Coriobacteriia bacterium]|nr:ferrochelatase [Coriobacteriia bacterium]